MTWSPACPCWKLTTSTMRMMRMKRRATPKKASIGVGVSTAAAGLDHPKGLVEVRGEGVVTDVAAVAAVTESGGGGHGQTRLVGVVTKTGRGQTGSTKRAVGAAVEEEEAKMNCQWRKPTSYELLLACHH